MDWKPLSVREGQLKDDGPYEGVPTHLYEPLRHWVDKSFGGMPHSQANTERGRQLGSATSYGSGRVIQRSRTFRRDYAGPVTPSVRAFDRHVQATFP